MKNKKIFLASLLVASIPLFGWIADAWDWISKAVNGAGFA
jgi:hypothetical protein